MQLDKPAVKIAINGFGRIGRALYRVLLERPEIEVAAINELGTAEAMAHLLRYDTVHGRLNKPVTIEGDSLIVDGRAVKLYHRENPGELPWRDSGVEIALECTGKFTGPEANLHLGAGARRVLVSAPAEGAELTVVYGVNHNLYDPARHRIVSNGSCTTNCLAPIALVLDEAFGIQKGLVTTVHSYTSDQKLLDNVHRDFRRGRSAAVSIVPTTTGAATAVGLVLPKLAGKLDGVSVRVPTPDVSLADITLSLARRVSAGEINGALKRAAEKELTGVLGYTEEPLVSADWRGSPYSAVVDSIQTRVVDGDLVKITAWYDNEWGYANRLADLIEHIAAKTK